MFSNVDLRSDYRQLSIRYGDVTKSAFEPRYGHYEFLVVPFGLTNSDVDIMDLMNRVFQKFDVDFVIIFVNVILFYSENEELHENT